MQKSAQDKGREFEKEMCEQFGARESIASGALWFDKLDGSGIRFRLSSKYTDAASFILKQITIDEAVQATQGMGGNGDIPIWAIRMQDKEYDLIVMRKNDFMQLLEEPDLIEIKRKEDKFKKSKTPILMRDND